MVAFGVRRVYMHKLGVSGYLAFHVLRTRARNRAQYNDLRHKKTKQSNISHTHRLMSPNNDVFQRKPFDEEPRKRRTGRRGKGNGGAQVLGDVSSYTICLKRRWSFLMARLAKPCNRSFRTSPAQKTTRSSSSSNVSILQPAHIFFSRPSFRNSSSSA